MEVKPGRPPKNKIIVKNENENITQTPYDDKNHMEFVFDNPLVFKKIFSLFKNYNSKFTVMEFLKDRVLIKTTDRNAKTIILITIDMTKCIHYYLKSDISIEFDTKSFHTITDTIHKTYNNISINLETKNLNKFMLVKFFDTEINSDIITQFNCKNNEFKFPYSNDIFNTTDYNLSFVLNCNYFKKTIANLANITTDFVLRQIKNQPLLIVVESASENKTKSQIILSSDSIAITYNGPNLFTTSCKIGYISPLVQGLMGDSIKIYGHTHKNLIFEVAIEKNILMMINTEINK